MGLIRHEACHTARGAAGLRRVTGPSIVLVLALALGGCEYFEAHSLAAKSAADQSAEDVSGTDEGAAAANEEASAVTAEKVQPDETVREVQTHLARLGYEPGPADGVLGHRTLEAIRRYRQAAGIPGDGKIDELLLGNLRAGRYMRPGAATAQMVVSGGAAASAVTPMRRLPVNGTFGAELGDIQPIYTVGDAFVWSSGHVDRVVRVGADNVVWRSTDGSGHTTFRNFATPYLEWQNESIEQFSTMGIDPQGVWPLAVGAKVEFQVATTVRSLGEQSVAESTARWHCVRGADVAVEVPAGRFETVVVTCVRTPVPKESWRKRVWYYAPAVRHIVRLDSFDAANQPSSERLISLRPAWRDWPPAARAGLDWAVQDTLTNGEEGIGVEWRSSGVGTKLIILPGVEFKAKAGERCRKYALIQVPPMTPRVYPAIACWDQAREKWLVPGLDDYSAPIAAVG